MLAAWSTWPGVIHTLQLSIQASALHGWASRVRLICCQPHTSGSTPTAEKC